MVISSFVVAPGIVVVSIEALEGKAVIVVMKFVKSEAVEDEGDPPPRGIPDVVRFGIEV